MPELERDRYAKPSANPLMLNALEAEQALGNGVHLRPTSTKKNPPSPVLPDKIVPNG